MNEILNPLGIKFSADKGDAFYSNAKLILGPSMQEGDGYRVICIRDEKNTSVKEWHAGQSLTLGYNPTFNHRVFNDGKIQFSLKNRDFVFVNTSKRST